MFERNEEASRLLRQEQSRHEEEILRLATADLEQFRRECERHDQQLKLIQKDLESATIKRGRSS